MYMQKKERWQQRLEDFSNALQRLQDGLEIHSPGDLERDGVIQRFEFTFELAWKTMKDFLEYQGIQDTASPKNVLRKAFQNNLIEDGELWMQMLEDRNSLSHLYKQEMSVKIFEAIKTIYCEALQKLKSFLQKESV